MLRISTPRGANRDTAPACGFTRRFNALMADGHSFLELARQIGITDLYWLDRFLDAPDAHPVPRALVTTAARLLDELPRPTGPAADQARADAAAAGYLPRDHWLDDPAEYDDPDCQGDDDHRYTRLVRLTWSDIDELAGPDPTPGDIAGLADRFGVKPRTIRDGLNDYRAGRRQNRRLRSGQHAQAFLTDDDVRAIRAEYLATRGTTWSGKATAARYSIARSSITNVIKGRYARHLNLSDLTAARPAAPQVTEHAGSPAGGDPKEATAA